MRTCLVIDSGSLVWADGGYAGRLVTSAKAVLHLTITIVERSDDIKGVVVLPRRWAAERTFGWLIPRRRLVRDYERKPEHHEAMVWWATVTIMTRRLTRELAGAPPPSDQVGEPVVERQPRGGRRLFDRGAIEAIPPIRGRRGRPRRRPEMGPAMPAPMSSSSPGC